MANYFEIDDVLAEDEFVPVVFQQAADGVGILDSSDDTSKVEAGSKLELPFWLARDLHLRGVVSINVPPYFKKVSRTRKEIGADAAHVDLRNRCQYFYELGLKIAPLVGDETIGPFLLVAFQTRYKEVLIKAHTAASVVAPKHLTFLTNEEIKCEMNEIVVAAFIIFVCESTCFAILSFLLEQKIEHNCLLSKCTRLVNYPQQHLRNGEWVVPDCKKLLFLDGRGNQLISWSSNSWRWMVEDCRELIFFLVGPIE